MGAGAAPAPGPTPPAMAMWLSLIRIASSRPKRWLAPPPQRTAYFSTARRPGVVLRVQTTRARVWAIGVGRCGGGGGDAAEVAEEVQRHALGGQDAAGGALDAGDDVARLRAVAVLAHTVEPDRRVDQPEGERGQIQAGDRAGLAGDEGGLAWVRGGISASEVMSPARPRSSSRAARTSGSSSTARQRAHGAGGPAPARQARANARACVQVSVMRAPDRRACGKSVRAWPPRLSCRRSMAPPSSGRVPPDRTAPAARAARSIGGASPAASRSTPAWRDRMARTGAGSLSCGGRHGASAPPGRRATGHAAAAMPAGDGGFQQRVAGQPVGAVQPGAGRLAHGPQAGHGGAAIRIHGDAAHVVMRGRADRDRRRGGSMPAAWQAAKMPGKCAANRAPRQARASRNTRWPARMRAQTARLTTSRGSSSARPRASSAMKRVPVSSIRVAPSPRTASLTSGIGRRRPTSSAVGWNCTNSRSASAAPARAASISPSPIAPAGLVLCS